MKAKILGCMLAACLLTACDDNTGTLGITDNDDLIEAGYERVGMKTTTIRVDSVPATNPHCYLGEVTDPETGYRVKADFLAQFFPYDSYMLPKKEKMMQDEQGRVIADSIHVRLYFTDYYGDPYNVMKMNVYELDTLNVPEEDRPYFSNMDLKQFIQPERKEPLAKKVFTPRDLNVDDSQLEDDNYYPNVCVTLPREYGNFILNKYYENPEYFGSSYEFARHVCPGFYFETAGGDGTMLYLDVSSVDIYFRYKDRIDGKDSIVNDFTRFAATSEVLQSNSFDVSGADRLIEEARNSKMTHIKSPAGMYTELTFPVKEILAGHEKDTVNNVKLTLNKYNDQNEEYGLKTPQNLLLVAKKNMNSFFTEKKQNDNVSSFLAPLNANQYAYGNLAPLISYFRQEKEKGMKESGLSEEEWEKKNPDWNKAVLIPVTTITNTTTGFSRITPDLRMGGARLEGELKPVDLHIIYSKYSN